MIIGESFSLPGKLRNVLVIQLGDIGDVVWSLPAFQAVRAALPRAEIFLLVRKGIGSLLEADPAITGIFEVERYPGNIVERLISQIPFLVRIRKVRFGLVFDLTAQLLVNFTIRTSRANSPGICPVLMASSSSSRCR